MPPKGTCESTRSPQNRLPVLDNQGSCGAVGMKLLRYRTLIFLVVLLQLSAIGPAVAQDSPLSGADQAMQKEQAPENLVPIETNPEPDEAIAQRLREVLANLKGLEEVKVEVDAGVVRLSGEALSSESRRQAEELAQRVEGVVTVENAITEERNIERRLRPAIEKLRNRILSLITYLPILVIAGLIMLLFWFVAKLIGAWAALFEKLSPNQFLRDLLRQAVRGLLLLIGLLVALDFLGATAIVGTVLGAAGLIGLAVSFAFRDTIENYIASILLSLRQPFAPNDHVVIEGHEGRVVRLTSRATILLTLNGNHVRIPNAKVFQGIVINYTRNPNRRFEFLVRINAAANLNTAQAVTVRALDGMNEILSNPAPQCSIEELGDWNVTLNMSGWVDQRRNDFLKVRSEALRRVKQTLDDAGIGMPEPIYRLHLKQSETAVEHHTDIALSKNKQAKVAGMQPSSSEEAQVDLSPDTHLAGVVHAERAVAKDKDLLNSQAPLE